MAQANPKHPLWRKPTDWFLMSKAGSAIGRRIAHHIDRPLLWLSRGHVSLAFGMPALMLTTTGAKSGRERSVPLLYIRLGDDVVVIGTRWGSTEHPAWHYNLQANPRARIRVKGEWRDVTARPATPEEREQIWPQAVRIYPGSDKYLPRVGSREVPIYILARGTAPPSVEPAAQSDTTPTSETPDS